MLETYNNNQILDNDPAFIPRRDQSEKPSLFCPTPIKPTSPQSSPKKKREERTESLNAASQEIFTIYLSNMFQNISLESHVYEEEDEEDDIDDMEFEDCFGFSFNDGEETYYDDIFRLDEDKKKEVRRPFQKSVSTSHLRFVWNQSPPPKNNISSSLGTLNPITPPVRTSNPLPLNSSFCVYDTHREGAEVGLLSLSPPL